MQMPSLGFGLGLRTDHYQHILDHRPAIDWFEALSENYMVAGGKPKYFLHKIREQYPIVLHGVSMSIGSTDPLDENYLLSLQALIDEIEPEWVSDHLCWTGVSGVNTHDLMPLPYTEEAIANVVERIVRVQDWLKRPLLIENVSSYITYEHSGMSEREFYTEVVERADCLMLLDLNNIYVSARNHDFDPLAYIDAINQKGYEKHLEIHFSFGRQTDPNFRQSIFEVIPSSLKF